MLPRFLNPVLFQGMGKTKNYVESWYFKQSLSDSKGLTQRTLVIIPGITWDAKGTGHSFIKTMDSLDGSSTYASFPIEAFSFRDRPFLISIGNSTFSLEGIHLDIQDGATAIMADLSFRNLTPIRPIMGPYTFVPFMECTHAIISMYHQVEGRITLVRKDQKEEILAFAPGIGYLEKDWGRSLPSSWIWIHANWFEAASGPVSFFFSLAKIPWLGNSFNGFISILHIDEREYRFASYRQGRIDLLEYQDGILRVLLSDHHYKVEILVRLSEAGKIPSPEQGTRNRRIGAYNNAWVRVVVKTRHKMTDVPLFDGIATGSSVELVGDIHSLHT